MAEQRVADVMTKDPIVGTLPGTRADVLRLLVEHKVTGVPVVKSDGTYAGIVARKHFFAKPEEDQLALLVKKDAPHVTPDTSLDEVVNIVLQEDVHHVAVCEDSKVVGIVTPADLLPVVADLGLETPVEDVLHSTCVSVHEGTPVEAANEIMRVARVFALPVLDDTGKLTGIITDRDIFNLSGINGTAAIQDMGFPEEGNPWDWEGLRNVMKLYYEERKVGLPKIVVREVMVKKVTTVSSKTAVSEAARTMAKHDYGQLPVRDPHDRLLGLLTEKDVIRVLL